jgi:hypothetical protein
LVGVLMLAVGLYYCLDVLVLANIGLALPPILVSESGWNDLLAWTSAAVAVFGATEVIWPTQESID